MSQQTTKPLRMQGVRLPSQLSIPDSNMTLNVHLSCGLDPIIARHADRSRHAEPSWLIHVSIDNNFNTTIVLPMTFKVPSICPNLMEPSVRYGRLET